MYNQMIKPVEDCILKAIREKNRMKLIQVCPKLVKWNEKSVPLHFMSWNHVLKPVETLHTESHVGDEKKVCSNSSRKMMLFSMP